MYVPCTSSYSTFSKYVSSSTAPGGFYEKSDHASGWRASNALDLYFGDVVFLPQIFLHMASFAVYRTSVIFPVGDNLDTDSFVK
jgi:hypothetical protein